MSEEAQRQPIASSPLTVILPAHNAEACVAESVRAWTEFLDSLERDYEIILVDDGSSDGTAKAAAELAEQRSRLKVLTHSSPHGFGACLRTGLAAARHLLVCYSTCGATPAARQAYQPRELQRLLDRIDRVDLVSGYRAGRPLPPLLRAAGFLWRWFVRIVFGIPLDPLPGWLGGKACAYQKLIRLLFGVRIGDIDSAFKLFRREIFDKIPIQSDGEFVHAEILAKANFIGCLMDEVELEEAAEWRSDPRRFSELREVFRFPKFGPATVAPVA
jgi:glycosyltransferase involved in cell wall biosynthesis